jgi:hypothetical protein
LEAGTLRNHLPDSRKPNDAQAIATVRVLFVQAARARSEREYFLPSDLVGLLQRGANVLFRMRGEMG